jgi:hypothetical protein
LPGYPRIVTGQIRNMERLSLERRRAILNSQITQWIQEGYQVRYYTDTEARLTKPKKFGWFWALAWFLVFQVMGVLVYVLYYLLAKSDRTVYLRVDEYGAVITTAA